jgi:hypothetical protein
MKDDVIGETILHALAEQPNILKISESECKGMILLLLTRGADSKLKTTRE